MRKKLADMDPFVRHFFESRKVYYGNGWLDIYLERNNCSPRRAENIKVI